uniref:ATP-binding protein n=1 Tax=Nonomuraea pusilla TaxID=46177 RepID=UPI0006E2171B|nr:LuxR family transcriptional regulator [Nonomuraea pusilla]
MTGPASPALVGRDAQLRALLQAIGGPPAVILVQGEAGIGKTRLVRAATERLRAERRTVLLGHCHQLREPFPYGPVLDALRHAASALPPVDRLNPVTGALRGHLPELAGQLPPAPTPPPLDDVRAERHRLFRAVHALLAAAAPATLVVEDLHWADDGTRDLLRFLTDQPPEGLALVVTFRREDLPVPGLPFGHAYRPQPGVRSEVISLAPLDVEDVRNLTGALLGGAPVPKGFAATLHERTAGVPFVIEEVVRSLLDDEGRLPGGAEGPEVLDRLPVPLLLREAMAEQLAGLSPAALRVVRAAAVLRVPADEPLLAAVSGEGADDEKEGAETPGAGLSEAVKAGVLLEQPDGQYGFRHALAQQAAYDAIPGPDRWPIHRRAMAALSTLDPAPLVQLAYHARRAGDLEAWRRHGGAAADHAAAVGDVPLAVEVLEAMLADPKLPPDARGPLALRLSRIAAVGLSYRRVVRLLRHLLSDDFLSRHVRGEARLNLGVLLSNQAGSIAEGRQEILTALPDLHDRPGLAARGLALLAMPAWGSEPLSTHEAWMDEAEKLLAAVEDQDPELTAAVHANKVTLAMLVGSPDAFSLVSTLPVNHPSAAVRRQAARAYSNLCDAAMALGHYGAAEGFAARSRTIAEESGALYPVYLVEMSSVRLHWLTGRWEGLRERAVAAVEMTPEAPLLAVDARLVLGMLALARGEWEEAAEQLGEAGVRDCESGFLPVAVLASAGLIELHLARGALDAALSEAEWAVGRLRRKGIWVWGDQLVPQAVEALLKAGRSGEAAGLVAEFAAGVERRTAPSAHAALGLALGALAEHEGGHEDAAARYAEAKAAYEAMPRPHAAARAAEAEAGVRLALGARDEAARLVGGAAERYAALGATRDAARCRRLLREIGAAGPARRARKAGGGVLSPREAEVARLVALGHTNREIAEVLFLSRRTVDTHVARVLHKLGVRTRNDVREPRPDDRPGPEPTF